jgi:hypothetical protein
MTTARLFPTRAEGKSPWDRRRAGMPFPARRAVAAGRVHRLPPPGSGLHTLLL